MSRTEQGRAIGPPSSLPEEYSSILAVETCLSCGVDGWRSEGGKGGGKGGGDRGRVGGRRGGRKGEGKEESEYDLLVSHDKGSSKA